MLATLYTESVAYDLSRATRILAAAVVSFEENFLVIDGTAGPTAQTGEAYREVMSGGMADEGQRSPCFCTTPEVAVDLWEVAAKRYASGCGGSCLYWRIKPEIDVYPLYERSVLALVPEYEVIPVWRVYSRLLVSSIVISA